ncbi:fam-b protein [Plasmodium vinckei brucechwatti]|uniref:Fam-b protein n=1 Tax=Plasmodium vinckei brucechwatti TaxID=119398 RepID=A0A6V7SK83_PLAVN|nr:fam-b protein [Plasmodium vinckei brucechwatti]
MRVSILKFVFFSINICSFECAKKELYFINGRNIYLEKNITNFRNNRILADADNQFDLNNFYESTLSLANQFSDYIDDDEEIKNLRNTIDSRIKKHKRSDISPNLNNIDEKTKNLIYELQKELEEVKKEIDSIRNNEIPIQPIQNKRTIINGENISVSEHEGISQLENEGNISGSEHNEISSSSKNKLKNNSETKKLVINFIKKCLLLIASFLALFISPALSFLILIMPNLFDITKSIEKFIKLKFKNIKKSK